ncbi:MAG: hypothetical protein GY847_25895 [Proteobacteria bacterium]|nr:hypothetical protein [Pseudomonadota bacterium]
MLKTLTLLAMVTATAEAPSPAQPTDVEPTASETGDPNTVSTRFIPGKGLDITSRNNDFRIVTKLFGQVLYTMSHEEKDEEDDTTQSLQIRRARLIFSGHWFGEHNKYNIQLAFSPRDLQFKDGSPTKSPVFDWYLTFDYLRDLSFRLGQYRVPYSRQRRISIAKLQLIDRALANHEFNLDRDIGMDFHSKDFLGLNLLRYNAGVFIGKGRDAYEQADPALLYSARIELLPLGMFDDYVETDLKRRKRPAMSIGAAYAFIDQAEGNKGILGSRPEDGGTTDTHNLTADIMFKVFGISLLSEFFYRKGKRNYGDATIIDDSGTEIPAPREDPRDGLGWFAQVGWLVPVIPVELSARYSQVHPVGDQTSLGRGDEVGGGINWQIFGNSIKLSADYFHIFKDEDKNGLIDNVVDQVRIQLQAGF